jgi:hypothetical protein
MAGPSTLPALHENEKLLHEKSYPRARAQITATNNRARAKQLERAGCFKNRKIEKNRGLTKKTEVVVHAPNRRQ